MTAQRVRDMMPIAALPCPAGYLKIPDPALGEGAGK